jgi:hypothetical protein
MIYDIATVFVIMFRMLYWDFLHTNVISVLTPNIAVGCDMLKNKVWDPPKLGVEIMDNLEIV